MATYWVCTDCGHEIVQRQDRPSANCPQCNSWDWAEIDGWSTPENHDRDPLLY